MNGQLIEDPLTAERAVRSGRTAELDTRGQRAWAEYIRRSDLVSRAMGVDPEAGAAAGVLRGREGAPVADAWRGVSPFKRAYVSLVLKPYARKAMWAAHRASIADGRPKAASAAAEVHRRAPKEMEFSAGLATMSNLWSYLSPPVTGLRSPLVRAMEPPRQLDGTPRERGLLERAFTRLLDAVDTTYERDIAGPTDAADAGRVVRDT